MSRLVLLVAFIMVVATVAYAGDQSLSRSGPSNYPDLGDRNIRLTQGHMLCEIDSSFQRSTRSKAFQSMTCSEWRAFVRGYVTCQNGDTGLASAAALCYLLDPCANVPEPPR